MKNLQTIAEKFKSIDYNFENYEIGGGLDSNKFASNRHEDALSDPGKVTFGKACQIFKKATGESLDRVKKVIRFAVPCMEWHHAGKLPKKYGGGMKKTYFVTSCEMENLAENWHEHSAALDADVAEKIAREKEKKHLLETRATRIERSLTPPLFFAEEKREMEGKYGWFRCEYKSYNLPIYYTGWAFQEQADYVRYTELNVK